MSLYDRDFHAWAHEQAALARARSSNALDWDNVAEELESLGKQQRSELKSRYRVLLMHLLKWMLQPNLRGVSWEVSVSNQREDIAELLAENPSLKSTDADVFELAYAGAVRDAVEETGLPKRSFPVEPPFTRDQAMDPGYWPDEA